MRLYIVRHAIAVPHGTPGVAEDDRPLTKEGIRKMNEAAHGLRALGCIPDVILTSPLPRAKQTADILVQFLGKQIPLELIDALGPSGAHPDVYKEIRRHEKAESVMLVGHQPSLGEIAGEIAWGSPEHYVELKKGGACAIEVEGLTPVPRGSMLWLVTPSILRTLAE
jgi:phosphohistidine phosphatase